MSAASPVPLGDFSKIHPLPGVTPMTEEQRKGTFWSSNPIFSYLNDVYSSVHAHRQSLSLSNPGSIENLNKEVSRDVFLSQYFFTGLRADLNKAFSLNPAFQTSHTLSLGSPNLPNYAFSALFANDNLFIQGNIDNDLSLSGRLNYGWDKNNISKVTLQLAQGQPTMCQLEQDFQGSDFSLNLKALNPTISSQGIFTGVAVGSILQSISPQFALGLEAIYSRGQAAAPADSAVSYVTRYVSSKQDWIFSGQMQANGALVASFWRKIAPNVEAGLETNLQASVAPITDPVIGTPIGLQPTIEGSTTLGCKYEYRQSVFRGSLDSNGKVACFLERKILPTLSILFCGEIDQFKQESKLGCGLQFETAGSEELLMLQQGLDVNGNPLQAPPPI
ncbi:LAMI_0C01838g1_1 [Lachancea mirantina]|uniref:Translocase of outer membrane 40 kDa subunit n=1 Tax=Lachancea mirantina TaxID=1230905 RepID=A0A1G4J0Z8_9SACH|nr:LAMI_0C01838g1_1 [Lachancea mirantina]